MTATEPSSPDSTPADNGVLESGLWLWNGATPPPDLEPASSQAPSRLKRIAHFFDSAHPVHWLIPPLGLALTGAAALAMVHFLESDEGVPRNAVAAVSQTASAPRIASARNPTPPAVLPTSQVEEVPPPAALVAKPMTEPTKYKAVNPRASRKSRHIRGVHPLYQWAWTSEPCRYHCDSGVPVSWHGGGY
jgi:cell wall-associated NlpC family hydrolase